MDVKPGHIRSEGHIRSDPKIFYGCRISYCPMKI